MAGQQAAQSATRRHTTMLIWPGMCCSGHQGCSRSHCKRRVYKPLVEEGTRVRRQGQNGSAWVAAEVGNGFGLERQRAARQQQQQLTEEEAESKAEAICWRHRGEGGRERVWGSGQLTGIPAASKRNARQCNAAHPKATPWGSLGTAPGCLAAIGPPRRRARAPCHCPAPPGSGRESAWPCQSPLGTPEPPPAAAPAAPQAGCLGGQGLAGYRAGWVGVSCSQAAWHVGGKAVRAASLSPR